MYLCSPTMSQILLRKRFFQILCQKFSTWNENKSFSCHIEMVKEIFSFFFLFFFFFQLSSNFTKNSSEVVSREGSMLPPPLLHPREWKALTGDFKTQPDSVLFQAVAIVKKVLQKPAGIEQSHRLTSGWVLKSSLKLPLTQMFTLLT